MPPTPPLPPAAELPSTPPTSPQRHQQAARNQERNQRLIGSPEQCRTPAIPSHSPSPPLVIVNGHELSHLPLDMRMQMINVPPHQPLRRRGNAPPQPFRLPLPPPSPPPPFPPAPAAGSSSTSITNLPLPPPPPPPAPFS
ncbi:hypothetical protein V8E52_009121 [Russula decolorans]|jgi:hypothetical protein